MKFISRMLILTPVCLVVGLAPSFASATASGIDTPLGVKAMPLAIEGQEVVRIVPEGILFPLANGTLNATAVTTLINLMNTAPCADGQALTKTGLTTFACTNLKKTTTTKTSSSSTTVKDVGCSYDAVTCALYQQTTGGLPEAGGAAWWQQQEAAYVAQHPGATDAQVLQAMKDQAATMPEVVNYATTGTSSAGRASVTTSGTVTATQTQIAADAATAASNNTSANIVQSLYQNVLGRSGEQAGVDYWTQQIQSGAMTVEQVQQAFVNSAEAQQNK